MKSTFRGLRICRFKTLAVREEGITGNSKKREALPYMPRNLDDFSASMARNQALNAEFRPLFFCCFLQRLLTRTLWVFETTDTQAAESTFHILPGWFIQAVGKNRPKEKIRRGQRMESSGGSDIKTGDDSYGNLKAAVSFP